MEKRLYRSKKEKMIAGVAGGLAEYLNVDPVIVRVAFVVLVLVYGIGLFAYVLLWIIVPSRRFEPIMAGADSGNEAADRAPTSQFSLPDGNTGRNSSIFGGILLITIGSLFLADNLIPGFGFDDFWPLIVITIGAGLLWNARKQRVS